MDCAFLLGMQDWVRLSKLHSNLLVEASLIKELPDVFLHAMLRHIQKTEIFKFHFRPSIPQIPCVVQYGINSNGNDLYLSLACVANSEI